MYDINNETHNIIWKSYHQYFCKIYFTTEFQCEIGIPFHEICIEIVTVNKTLHYTWLIFELISVCFNAMCLSFQMYFGFVNGSTAENDIISLFLPRLFYFSSFFHCDIDTNTGVSIKRVAIYILWLYIFKTF